MGTCFSVEIRDSPDQDAGNPRRGRHSVVREKNKSSFRRSDESRLYRPRSSNISRDDEFRARLDPEPFEGTRNSYEAQSRARPQSEYHGEPVFYPLPPPLPPAPAMHNHPARNSNPHGLEILGPGERRSRQDDIQFLGEPGAVAGPPRSPHSHRSSRRVVLHPSRGRGRDMRQYEDSDEDSWVERRPRSFYSEDARPEVYRPGRTLSQRRRSRSRDLRYRL